MSNVPAQSWIGQLMSPVGALATTVIINEREKTSIRRSYQSIQFFSKSVK
jgi:hypothetical protein